MSRRGRLSGRRPLVLVHTALVADDTRARWKLGTEKADVADGMVTEYAGSPVGRALRSKASADDTFQDAELDLVQQFDEVRDDCRCWQCLSCDTNNGHGEK